MVHERFSAATVLVKAIAAINFFGHAFGAAVTLVLFGILEPRLAQGDALDGMWNRTTFFVAVAALAVAVIAPFNARLVLPLYRKVKRTMDTEPDSSNRPPDLESIRELAGDLFRLPVKLAATSFLGWVIAAAVVTALPHIAPDLFPWPVYVSHSISSWLVFVAAPITVSWAYFAQERWLRLQMPKLLPTEALLSTSPAFTINVLPKLLVVCILIATVPGAVISYVTLHQIRDIQAGTQLVENFLHGMPAMIVFLLGIFTILGAGLSMYLAKSVSEPLKDVESAMEAVRTGNLDISVPVVSNDEIGRMTDGFNKMIHDHKQLDSIRDTFGRYVSEDVVAEILKSPGGMELTGEMRNMTILVSDLRGFTQVTESLEPHSVLELINRYLERMTDIILKHHGTIDEFTGDGILVFFGAPRALPDHSQKALRCALEMQQSMQDLNRENVRRGLPEICMGIGINSGDLIVGNIGSEKRKKYGAMGSPINVAFRIQALAEGGEILVSPSVRDNADGEIAFQRYMDVHLKGLQNAMALYRVPGTGENSDAPAEDRQVRTEG